MADDAKRKAVHARVPPLDPLRPPLLMEPVLGGQGVLLGPPSEPRALCSVSSLWSSPCSLRMLGWQLNRHLRCGALGDECPLPLQGRGGAPSTATTRTGWTMGGCAGCRSWRRIILTLMPKRSCPHTTCLLTSTASRRSCTACSWRSASSSESLTGLALFSGKPNADHTAWPCEGSDQQKAESLLNKL